MICGAKTLQSRQKKAAHGLQRRSLFVSRCQVKLHMRVVTPAIGSIEMSMQNIKGGKWDTP
jgi:hypothetical protein